MFFVENVYKLKCSKLSDSEWNDFFLDDVGIYLTGGLWLSEVISLWPITIFLLGSFLFGFASVLIMGAMSCVIHMKCDELCEVVSLCPSGCVTFSVYLSLYFSLSRQGILIRLGICLEIYINIRDMCLSFVCVDWRRSGIILEISILESNLCMCPPSVWIRTTSKLFCNCPTFL